MTNDYVRGYLDAIHQCEEGIRAVRLFVVTRDEMKKLADCDATGKLMVDLVEALIDALISGCEKARRRIENASNT